MAKALSFQQVILRLQEYWEQQGCLIWQPYSEKVGAGTGNPATALRVLGPEPWWVAYVEPSYRPDDGRYGDNPNRMQLFYQFQVILKPEPPDPQQMYLDSLAAVGIDRRRHDIRFVEDNWESPALGAWGLGWEVWLDGQEISQYTYFQQAGGFPLEPVSVELTYGLERIVLALQGVRSVWEIDWDGQHTYGDVLLTPEIEHCRYDFEIADVDRLTQMYNLFEAEARACLEHGLVVPAHDYVLRCSHAFNVLDARGAIGVTERANYFRRMRDISRAVAVAYVEQRQRMEYPWLDESKGEVDEDRVEGYRLQVAGLKRHPETQNLEPETLLLEIGTEELPAGDLSNALVQLREMVPARLAEARLAHGEISVMGTPRRLVVLVQELAPWQQATEELVKGPPARAAFDAAGVPTRAAEGFARKQGVALSDLERREMDGGEYLVAVVRRAGRPTGEVLSELLPGLVAGLHFGKSMRWNASGVTFSRPIRWFVVLLGESVVPFAYAGLQSGRTSRGPRASGSPAFEIASAGAYPAALAAQQVVLDPAARRALILQQAQALAQGVGGRVPDDPALLEEIANLVEQPTPFLGQFDTEYLKLPAEILIAVMKKHQRYFPVASHQPSLLPYFIAVRNGGTEHLDVVRHGNEEVIRARFADAEFFYREDSKQALEAFLPRLDTLTFQEKLGSMLDKARRLASLAPALGRMVGADGETLAAVERAAYLSKADLATKMVVEMTSLQGIMGRQYALNAGEPPEVAQAIFEHYLPRYVGDALPQSRAGLLVGLADRLDSLVGLFAAGLQPTGNKDPFALRRAAVGVVQNLLAAEVSIPLGQALQAAAELAPVPVGPQALADVEGFIIERLRVVLREMGFRHDVVDAVLAARGSDPYRARLAVEQLTAWIARPDWPGILDNYARCVRITRDLTERLPLDPQRFVQPVETDLYQVYQQVRALVTPESTVDEFLNAFLLLVPVIERYFARESGVMVMDENLALRQNRLAQLQHIAALADGIVDLSKLEGF